MTRVYKILGEDEWKAATAKGFFEGTGIDLRDGYIHLSTGAQASETARLHFAGRDDLVLVELDTEALGPTLKWERSRGEQLFPHLHAPLATRLARGVRPLALNGAGWPDPGPLEP